jgi:hypothetical protein
VRLSRHQRLHILLLLAVAVEVQMLLTEHKALAVVLVAFFFQLYL